MNQVTVGNYYSMKILKMRLNISITPYPLNS
jgi:hypothetical protein